MDAIEDHDTNVSDRSNEVAKYFTRTNYAETFGKDPRWLGAHLLRHGGVHLAVFEYADFETAISLTRDEAIALRDFLTANIR